MYIVQKLFCLDKSDRQGILRLVVQSQINQVFQVGWWGKVGLEHSFMWLKIHFCELENSRLFTEFQCLQAGLYFQVHRCNFLRLFAGVSICTVYLYLFSSSYYCALEIFPSICFFNIYWPNFTCMYICTVCICIYFPVHIFVH